MRSFATASLCSHRKPIGTPFRHPDGGGNHLRWPYSSSRRPPRWGGSSPPSGLRVCTSSYVFNLSLSRDLEMSRSWCIMGFVNIDGSYDVAPLSTLVVMNWIFTLWSFVMSDWMFRFENTWCMPCGMNTWGDNGVSYWFTWYMFCHSTRGFPRWHWGNLCIGVDACFYYLFSGRNIGVSL